MAPKWLGPATIVELNESVAKIKLSNNRHKTFNVKRLKHFVPRESPDDQNTDQLSHEADPIDADPASTGAQNFDALSNPNRPRTRAWSKLIKTDAASALIEQDIWYKLNEIAYKLYHLNLTFKQLTPQEELFWKSFDQKDIFEWLTGDPERPPDYQEYITVRGSARQQPNVQQPQQPAPQPPAGQAPLQQPLQQPPQPGPSGTATTPKRGRPPGSKNKPKDTFTRIAHYASKRITRATSGALLPKQ